MPTPGFQIQAAYQFAIANGLQQQAESIRNMPIHPSIVRPAAARKGRLVELFEHTGIIEQFAADHWPGRRTPAGDKLRARLLRYARLNRERLDGTEVYEDPGEEGGAPDEPTLFALEAHLRDFIARNLGKLAIDGVRLRLFRDENGRSGVEYRTDVGLIDILTIDEDGNFFVFELKVDRGPDRALGQLARYMGWVKRHLAANKDVTGVIVANAIDQKLRYAATVLPQVVLLEYELDFRIRGVDAP